MVDVDALPAIYVELKPKKSLINADAKSGADIDGVEKVQKTSLVVR